MTARKATVQLAETFTISRGSEDEAHVIQVAIEHDGVSGHGEAAPIERYRESVESGLAWLEEVELPDDPFALDELAAGLPAGEHAARAALDHALHDLQGKLTGLPVYRLLGLRRARPAPRRAADLVDDLARRSRRHGASHREDREPRLPPAQAEARRTRRARRRARERRTVGDEPAAPVRRERSLDTRRSARVPAADEARLLRAAA